LGFGGYGPNQVVTGTGGVTPTVPTPQPQPQPQPPTTTDPASQYPAIPGQVVGDCFQCSQGIYIG